MAFPTAPTEDVVESVIQQDIGNADSVMRAFMDSRYYSVFNIRRNDDVSTIQAKLNSAAAVGAQVPVLFPQGATLYIPSTLTVPAGVRLLGNDCTLITDQNIPVLTLGGDGISGRDLGIVGSLPDGSNGSASMANQMGIFYTGGTGTYKPINAVKFKDMRIASMYGFGAQIIHGRRIKFQGCEFDGYCRAGLWFTSVIGGRVDHNDFYGMNDLYLGTTFTYAFTATVQISTSGANAGLITDTINPRSQNIDVTTNYAEDQAWECFDTHLGDTINFTGNKSRGPGAVVAAVQNDSAPAYSPRNINIDTNTQATDLDTVSNGGIALIGSKDYTNPNRELATGSISNNVLNGAYTDGLTASGAINVSNSQGVPIVGNTLQQCKSIGFFLRNSFGSDLVGNSVIDLWRSDAGSICYYLINDDTAQQYSLMSTANIIIRSTLSRPFVNSFMYGGTASPSIDIYHSNDAFDGAATSGAANAQDHHVRIGLGTLPSETLGFYGSNGTGKPLSPGIATLSNVDGVVNNLVNSLRALGMIT